MPATIECRVQVHVPWPLSRQPTAAELRALEARLESASVAAGNEYVASIPRVSPGPVLVAKAAATGTADTSPEAGERALEARRRR